MEEAEFETVDLRERLKVATQTYEPVSEEAQPEPPEDPEEFTPKEDFPDLQDLPDSLVNEGKQAGEEAEPEEVEFEPQDVAAILIGGTDFLQTSFFKSRIQKQYLKELGDDQVNRLNELAKGETSGTTTLDDQDLQLLEKLREFEGKLKALPFTDEESDLLRKPLEKVIAKYNFKMTAEWALVLAAGQVMLPRVLMMRS